MEYAYVKRIRDLREDHDMSQRQVAKILGTSQTMYARYERGANEMPIRHLIMLCRLYHVSADCILGIDFAKKKAALTPLFFPSKPPLSQQPQNLRLAQTPQGHRPLCHHLLCQHLL